MAAETYDAIIIGGGHNGLVAGFYLARAGLSTLILERRPFVGGACNTEEFAPGFRASTGAYVLSMLREAIWQDMRLVQRGIVVDPAGPTLNLFPDGAHYYLGEDMAANVAETARFSPADARALPAFERHLAAMVQGVIPSFNWTAPDPRMRIARGPARARALGTDRRSAAAAAGRSRVPVLHERDAALVGTVRERAREGRARLARDQRQRRRSLDAGHRLRLAARPRERGGRGRCPAVGLRAGRDGPAHRGHGRRRTGGGLHDPVRGGCRACGHGAAVAPSACSSRTARRSALAACSRTRTRSARS